MASCQQCGKPPLYVIGPEKIPLCLDCYERHDNILQRQLDENARMLNYLTGQMESVVGLPYGSLGPRMAVRSQTQPVTLNNIHIDRSNIGAVNTGQAGRIDAVVTYTNQAGDPALAQALKYFTQAVIDSKEIDRVTRDAIIEQLSFLASQIATNKKQPSVADAVASKLGTLIKTASGLITLWKQLEPLLKSSIGF